LGGALAGHRVDMARARWDGEVGLGGQADAPEVRS
jgi:hypothetical protein